MWKLATLPSEPVTRAKLWPPKRGKARLLMCPPPRLRTSSSKRNSNTSVPTSAKRARRPSEAIPEDPAAADKTFIFCCLEQMITASDLQSLEGASPTYLL
nr:hypothetical protein Iba_chr02cCG9130 [Ipomoea batatas]